MDEKKFRLKEMVARLHDKEVNKISIKIAIEMIAICILLGVTKMT